MNFFEAPHVSQGLRLYDRQLQFIDVSYNIASSEFWFVHMSYLKLMES